MTLISRALERLQSLSPTAFQYKRVLLVAGGESVSVQTQSPYCHGDHGYQGDYGIRTVELPIGVTPVVAAQWLRDNVAAIERLHSGISRTGWHTTHLTDDAEAALRELQYAAKTLAIEGRVSSAQAS